MPKMRTPKPLNDGINHKLDAYRDESRREMNERRIAKCETKNGHAYTGCYEWEGEELWFEVIDENDNPYQTRELPEHRLEGLHLIHHTSADSARSFANAMSLPNESLTENERRIKHAWTNHLKTKG